MDKKKARVALRKSIKHWCIDIRKPFFSGDSIFENYWIKDGTKVKMYGNDCELCKLYNYKCYMCPLSLFGSKCNDRSSEYSIFRRDLNLKSANNMITVLIKAYKEVL